MSNRALLAGHPRIWKGYHWYFRTPYCFHCCTAVVRICYWIVQLTSSQRILCSQQSRWGLGIFNASYDGKAVAMTSFLLHKPNQCSVSTHRPTMCQLLPILFPHVCQPLWAAANQTGDWTNAAFVGIIRVRDQLCCALKRKCRQFGETFFDCTRSAI